jgi:predicted ribosome quality control (RQC) complex YloA/Tae2 family protein
MKSTQFEINSNTYNIMIGENKQDNWDIIDSSQPYWIWFHVESGPSSHVILQIDENTSIKDIPRQVIKRCACLCKTHSSSKSLKNIYIQYINIKDIEKTTVVGQVNLLKEPKKICI